MITESQPIDFKSITLERIAKAEHQLFSHPVFSTIDSITKLRIFMESHVFAVWDFMSLLKRLQIDLTTIRLPWVESRSSKAARLINEIVLAEETDVMPDGTTISHFSLYIKAMQEIGCNTIPVRNFIKHLESGISVSDALDKCCAPEEAKVFVNKTIQIAHFGNTIDVASWFFFGRESVIPGLFKALLSDWKMHPEQVPSFTYYLERHIQLDGDEHGPMAKQVIDILLQQNNLSYETVLLPALHALDARSQLWDSLYIKMKSYNI